MIGKASIARHGQRALKAPTRLPTCRALASAASGSFTYETGDAAGVKFASRDIPGPTTHLAVVAKAGTRYEPLPGFSEGLDKFAFKNTNKRSALRITRESELLGSEFSSYHSRENLVLSAKFLRDDLPYFAELLGEVISQTRFSAHELHEEVEAMIDFDRKASLGNPTTFAINSAHGVAFHRGLGNPVHPFSSTPITKYLNAELLQMYSRVAYAKSNFAVVANGASHLDLSKWVGQFFNESPATPPSDFPATNNTPSKYYGGEERIALDSGNAMIIAFQGSSSLTGGSYKPELAVLAALLGGQSNIKWASGFSLLSRASEAYPQAYVDTAHHTYSDAGLLAISIRGNAQQIRQASQEVVKAIKKVGSGEVGKDDIKKAIAAAKFKALESGQNIGTGIEMTGAGLVQGGRPFQIDEAGKSMDGITEEQVKKAAKALLDGKASVSAVGDLYVLPFAEEIGLQV